MASQCNPKCLICSLGPVQNEEILSLEWLKTETNAKGKLEFKKYGSSPLGSDPIDFGSGDIFKNLFDKPKSAPENSRFGWVHKRCIESMGDFMRNIKKMIRTEVEDVLKAKST